MLFNIILFIITFLFLCCFVPTNSTPSPVAEESFISEVKRAFSSEFDPSPEILEESSTTTVVPDVLLCLPPAKSSSKSSNKPSRKSRRSNQVNPINNEVLTTPFNFNNASNKLTLSGHPSYAELKQFVKAHNLQQMVKELTGKVYNKCKHQELLKALTA